ncbi:MAG: hypothetical protein QF790_01500 [Gammaproteobacteria bacterium]|jgi:hypothetical protein|nr:hypothetical protein [Gammaproteobacteria bacterium]MDP6615825.1 hypothetical protein [Gammaproteobacteria bacterium]MDP6694357.1 hypothetical protein [Gammaproteobacteria bacterium]MDP7041642.1 hypothetical protein [Gammaproteobacteria bacterium]
MSTHPDAGNNPSEGLGVIRISGADRRIFLQGQLTQDIDELTPGNPLLAGWVSPKGRLRCLAWVIDWHDAAWLILPQALGVPVARQLAPYVLRADVQIETPATGVHALHRSELGAVENLQVNPDKQTITHCIYNDNYLFLAIEQLPETGLLLSEPATAPEAGPTDWQAWRRQNVRAGLPSVWPESSEMFVPQMLNLDLLDAISFSKGCYVGQEIVARTQNLGRIKRRMYGFTADGEHHAGPGADLYSDGKKTGELVDAVCGDGRTELLAVVPIEKLNEPLWLDPDNEVPLDRVALPYRVPEQPG